MIFCPHRDYSVVGMSGSKEQITVNCDKLCDRASTGRGIQKGQYLKKASEEVWLAERQEGREGICLLQERYFSGSGLCRSSKSWRGKELGHCKEWTVGQCRLHEEQEGKCTTRRQGW